MLQGQQFAICIQRNVKNVGIYKYSCMPSGLQTNCQCIKGRRQTIGSWQLLSELLIFFYYLPTWSTVGPVAANTAQ